MPAVYMLRCSDDSLYTGAAVDIDKRFSAHCRGRASRYTASRLPVTLVYREETSTYPDALRRENQIKKLTKTEKEGLVASYGSRNDPGHGEGQ